MCLCAHVERAATIQPRATTARHGLLPRHSERGEIGDHATAGDHATDATEPETSDAPRLREGRREIHRVLRDIAQQGIAEGTFELSDPTLAVTSIETLCEYVFTWLTPDGRLSEEEVINGMVKIALRIVGYRATD